MSWACLHYTKTFSVKLSPNPDKMHPRKLCVYWRWSWESHHIGSITTMKLFNNFLAFQQNSQDSFKRRLTNFFCWETTGMKFSSQSVLHNLWSQPVFSWHHLPICLAMNLPSLAYFHELSFAFQKQKKKAVSEKLLSSCFRSFFFL